MGCSTPFSRRQMVMRCRSSSAASRSCDRLLRRRNRLKNGPKSCQVIVRLPSDLETIPLPLPCHCAQAATSTHPAWGEDEYPRLPQPCLVLACAPARRLALPLHSQRYKRNVLRSQLHNNHRAGYTDSQFSGRGRTAGSRSQDIGSVLLIHLPVGDANIAQLSRPRNNILPRYFSRLPAGVQESQPMCGQHRVELLSTQLEWGVSP